MDPCGFLILSPYDLSFSHGNFFSSAGVDCKCNAQLLLFIKWAEIIRCPAITWAEMIHVNKGLELTL